MLDFHNILWVIPGVVFIHFYNKRRPSGSLNLSGWSYIFSLVIIAILLWLPIFNIISRQTHISEGWQSFLISIISGFFAYLLALISTSSSWLTKNIFLPVYDVFFINCVNWLEKPVIVSLKNDKIYIGVLIKYPANPKSKYETQMISIYPLRSGGRDQNAKEVVWGERYPTDIKGHCEIIIPRSEIVTFGVFNEETFNYFYKKNQSNKP